MQKTPDLRVRVRKAVFLTICAPRRRGTTSFQSEMYDFKQRKVALVPDEESHLPVRMDERANEAIVVAMIARGLSFPISAAIVLARI
jgi:hypothetical protein